MLANPNRRLGVDLSGLWTQDNTRFIIRFRDLSEDKKMSLAKRIKVTAPYRRIRKENGPTHEQIYAALLEFNPVIFAEYSDTRNRDSYRNFAIYSAFTMTSWCFKKVCKGVFGLVCLRRPLRRNEIEMIVSTTTIDWNKTSAFMNAHFPNNQIRERIEERPVIHEIGVDEISMIRERLGEIPVPRAMRENDPITENTTINQYDSILRTITSSAPNWGINQGIDETIDQLVNDNNN